MAGWSSWNAGTRMAAGAGAALVLALVAFLLFGNQTAPLRPEDGQTAVVEPEQSADAPTETAAAETGDAPNPETSDSGSTVVATAEPEDAVQADVVSPPGTEAGPTATASQPVPGPAPVPPTFDVVRVDADGAALIAGRAMPGSMVELLLDGAKLTEERADPGGAFVVLATIPLAAVAQSLSLRMSSDGFSPTMSEQTVLISPVAEVPSDQVASIVSPAAPMAGAGGADEVPGTATGGGDSQLALAEPAQTAAQGTGTAAIDATEPITPATGGEAAGVSVPQSDDASADVAATPAADQPVASEPAAPAVILADEAGVTVLQSGGAPQVTDSIALDSIAYDDAGDVTLSGRGSGAGFVRVYIDDAPIKTLKIEQDGSWRAPLPEVDTGVYTLRLDEVNEAGQVVSRVETPFKREEPAVLAAAVEAGRGDGLKKPATVVTVQKGNTLWGISRERYGEGILYVQVYEANRGLIRDPDLIYPGQVFTLPSDTTVQE